MCDDLECLCKMMPTIGRKLDQGEAVKLMDQYFERMKKLRSLPTCTSQKDGLPSRIKFLIQDCIELRANQWQPRQCQLDSAPKTINELRNGEETPKPANSSLVGAAATPFMIKMYQQLNEQPNMSLLHAIGDLTMQTKKRQLEQQLLQQQQQLAYGDPDELSETSVDREDDEETEEVKTETRAPTPPPVPAPAPATSNGVYRPPQIRNQQAAGPPPYRAPGYTNTSVRHLDQYEYPSLSSNGRAAAESGASGGGKWGGVASGRSNRKSEHYAYASAAADERSVSSSSTSTISTPSSTAPSSVSPPLQLNAAANNKSASLTVDTNTAGNSIVSSTSVRDSLVVHT